MDAMPVGARQRIALVPTRRERALGLATLAMLGLTLAALWRGRGELGAVPPLVAAHLTAVLVAVALTPVMLWRRRGDRVHRLLGRVWVAAMMAAALLSFGVRTLIPGHFSPIHAISLFTVIAVPIAVRRARRGDIAGHRRAMLLLITGGLVIAGAFTFLPHRLLGHWLLGTSDLAEPTVSPAAAVPAHRTG